MRDRPLPNDLGVEVAVLGACLIASVDEVVQVADLIRPDDFYSTQNQLIAEAVFGLAADGIKPDQVSVSERLGKNLASAGGPARVAELAGEMATTVNLEYHCGLLVELSKRRKSILEWNSFSERAYDQEEPIDVIVDESAEFAVSIDGSSSSELVSHRELVHNSIEYVRDKLLDPEKYRGCDTGIALLNARLLGGLEFGAFSALGARPSVGKTALSLYIADSAARTGAPTLYFSAEMGRRTFGLRLLCLRSGVPLDYLAQDNIDDETLARLASAYDASATFPSELYVDFDTKEPYAMRRVARRAVRKLGVRMIVVDYLQLLSPPRGFSAGNREQEVAETSRVFKNLAAELDAHVMVCCQLSRAVEARDDKRPVLSDFRESGSIEQDADVAMMLYRPAYYGITEINGESTNGLLEINVAKQRNGPTGPVEVYYDLRTGRFEPWG